MNAFIDPLVVALIILTALGVLWRLKRRKKNSGCGCNSGGCGKK